jgi:hypothetical protein
MRPFPHSSMCISGSGARRSWRMNSTSATANTANSGSTLPGPHALACVSPSISEPTPASSSAAPA